MDPALFSSFPEWNFLPNEVKTNVIEKLDNNSRLALRACSSDSQKLVDAVPYHQIHKLSVYNEKNEWCIRISRSVDSNEIPLKFASFDEFQNQLTKEIKIYDYIQEMTISNEVVSNNVSLLRYGELVRIGALHLSEESVNLRIILEQVDRNYLKSLRLVRYITYTSQITCRNLIIMGQIRHVTFENSFIQLSDSVMHTSSGINNYIRKCLLNLDKSYVSFTICLSEDEDIVFSKVIEGLDIASSEWNDIALINSPFPNLQLEVKCRRTYVEGRTMGNGFIRKDVAKSRTQNTFNVIEFLEINHTGKNKVLTIGYKDKGQINYDFDSRAELQLKLTEELDEINYIKHLSINDSYDGWKLTSSTNNKITVGKLMLSGGNNRINYLRQIEPGHLKNIIMNLESQTEEVYDIPQVIHAKKLNLNNSSIRDDQLLKLNAVSLELQFENYGKNRNLTDYGINAYVKKCLLELNKHDFNFKFPGSNNRRKSSKFFKGLDIFSENQIDAFNRETIVNSPYPEYQLKLETDRYSIKGKRIVKV